MPRGCHWMTRFLSTPSARRATASSAFTTQFCTHFYPRPPRGERRFTASCGFSQTIFLSTPSARRATSRSGPTSGREKYFYPRPPRGGRHLPAGEQAAAMGISIHALREEGDRSILKLWKIWSISIHALCEEGDSMRSTRISRSGAFLSTPSARRAT